jgi:hypothetical protein
VRVAAYVIVGSTGQYSDHREWMVCAYANETDATIHAERARGAAAACHEQYRASWEEATDLNAPGIADFEGDDGIVFTSPWDPDIDADDWSERHRFHSAVTSTTTYEAVKYEVRRVPMRAVPPIPESEAHADPA